jgi:hypothetical protein
MLRGVVVENIILWSVSVPAAVFVGYLVFEHIIERTRRRHRRHHHRH